MTIEQARKFIKSHSWRAASSMSHIPHAYVVRKNCRLDSEFIAFVELIHSNGYDAMFGKTKYRYLQLDGFKYWTQGFEHVVTCIINRAELKKGEAAVKWKKRDDMVLKKHKNVAEVGPKVMIEVAEISHRQYKDFLGKGRENVAPIEHSDKNTYYGALLNLERELHAVSCVVRHKDSVTFKSVFVSPEHRGNRIGSALLLRMCVDSINSGYESGTAWSLTPSNRLFDLAKAKVIKVTKISKHVELDLRESVASLKSLK